MLKATKPGLYQATVARLPATFPVAEAPVAIAFDIWKAGDGLPVHPAAVATAARAVPAASGAPAAADARSGAAAPAVPLPLPSLDGVPDAWL
jgi:hypothetical protein